MQRRLLVLLALLLIATVALYASLGCGLAMHEAAAVSVVSCGVVTLARLAYKRIGSIERRWFQFSLRAFLLFVLALGLALGWLGTLIRRAHEQRQVVSQIKLAGGNAYYDYQLAGKSIDPQMPPPGPWILRKAFGDDLFAHVEVVMFEVPPGPTHRELELLSRLPRLRDVSIAGNGISDEDLADLLRVRKLRGLTLSTKVSPQGLSQLSGAPELVSLTLLGSWVIDAHLEPLDRLPSLTYLHLFRTAITDEGMHNLGRLRALRELSLDAPAVTDVGLEHVRDVRNLESLHLLRTGTTDHSLRVVSDLPRLRSVRVWSDVGDSGLECLGAMSDLRHLNVHATSASDAGLLKLHRLQALETMSLMVGPRTTTEGVAGLKRALRECKIFCFDSSGNPVGVEEPK